MQEIFLYNKEHEIIKVSLREIASWRDSKILITTPVNANIDLMKLVDEYRNQAITIELPINTNLDGAINLLQNLHKEDFRDYKANFNGTWLYSININEIDAYGAMTGMTREGCLKREQIERYRMQLYKEQMADDANKNLEKRINEGKKEIVEEKWELWEEVVEKLSHPPYYLHTIDTIIKYLQLLNKKYLSVTEIAHMFYQEFDNDTKYYYPSSILTYLARFSSRGIGLFRATTHIAHEKGDKLVNNKEYLKNLDNANKLMDLGIPYIEAEVLALESIYDVSIGLELKLKVINIDENLYEGISNTGKYTIIARIGNYYVTYLFGSDTYTRYINHIYEKDVLISTNNEGIKDTKEARITGIKMRNIMSSKARIYHDTTTTREKVNVSLILRAYKEISEFAASIKTNYGDNLGIDGLDEQESNRLTKTF